MSVLLLVQFHNESAEPAPRDEQGATTPQSPTPLPPRHVLVVTKHAGRTSSRLHDVMPSKTSDTYHQPEDGVSTKEQHTGGRASFWEQLGRKSSNPGSNSRRVSSTPGSRCTTSLSSLCTPFDDQDAMPPLTLPLHRTRPVTANQFFWTRMLLRKGDTMDNIIVPLYHMR